MCNGLQDLKAEVAFDLLPGACCPAVNIQLIRTKSRNRHCRIGTNNFIRSNIFRTQLEFASFTLTRLGQSIDCQAKVRKNIVINDIVKEYRVRIERFLAQDDAIIKCFFVANRSISGIDYDPNFRSNGQ